MGRKRLTPAPQDTAAAGAEKGLRQRNRQRLIDACISALHQHGPSRTTVEKVVSIADLSPGTVSFYFDSKDAMLVAALEYLAGEFDQLVMQPVAQLKDDPVRALALLVELYLDSEAASTRKVSVWYSFWGEANSRREYYEICGKRDVAFGIMVRSLIEGLLRQVKAPHLDVEGVALGLIGALEMLWQEFAFKTDGEIDRAGAKARANAYLRSVFPRQFGAGGASAAAPGDLPGWLYGDRAQFERERSLLLSCWHLVGREADLDRAGAYLTLDLLGERAVVVRGADGTLRGYRNRCRRRPHAVAEGWHGQAGDALRCPADGLIYLHDGTPGLPVLPVARRAGLVFIDLSGQGTPEEAPALPAFKGVDGPLGEPDETDIEADWKVLAELWLDRRILTGAAEIDEKAGIALRRDPALRLFLFPGLLVESGEQGLLLLQIMPQGPGRCRLRRFAYGKADGAAELEAEARIARSTQSGLMAPSHAEDEAMASPALRSLLHWLSPALPR